MEGACMRLTACPGNFKPPVLISTHTTPSDPILLVFCSANTLKSKKPGLTEAPAETLICWVVDVKPSSLLQTSLSRLKIQGTPPHIFALAVTFKASFPSFPVSSSQLSISQFSVSRRPFLEPIALFTHFYPECQMPTGR